MWRFSQQDLTRALRRQRCAATREGPHNYRAVIEATVRALKHPFRQGKVPVRGKSRVSMVLVGAAIMNNVRHIHRYLTRHRGEKAKQGEQRAAQFGSFHLPNPFWLIKRDVLSEESYSATTLFCFFLSRAPLCPCYYIRYWQ